MKNECASDILLYAVERYIISSLFTSLYHTLINAGEISQYSITMLFYRKTCVAFLLTFFVFVAATDQHLNANGPFGKRHSIKDEPSPYTCHRGTGLSSSSDLFSTLANTDLNVSTTVYASMDQIEVTWAPTLISCKNDLFGIYFVEIPIATGINM
jgi:hypothetical protein